MCKNRDDAIKKGYYHCILGVLVTENEYGKLLHLKKDETENFLKSIAKKHKKRKCDNYSEADKTTNSEYAAKSNFVKDKIKKTKWKDREHITNLLVLEKYILDGCKITGMAHSYQITGLKGEYEKEYLSLLKELDPAEHKKYLKELKEEDGEHEKLSKELLEEDKRTRKAWLKAGGKP